jgi:glyoxylase-like metal-dependent hydrolase (beta-lactamase superfamily II)
MVTSAAGAAPRLWHFHDAGTGTFTHLVACGKTRRAVLIDPVLGFDPGPARTNTRAAQQIASLIRAESLELEWVLETHIHADHLSSAQFFKAGFGARVAIGARVREVGRFYAPLFGLADGPVDTVSRFDRLWLDNERFHVGELEIEVLSTPGHTLDGVTYCVGGHAFVGDTVFRSNFGTARTDLAGGDAAALFRSISRLYALPDETVLHFCHDYPRGDSLPTEQTRVDRMRADNIHVSSSTTEHDFVALRRSRDMTLPVPDLLIPALQINLAAGCFPVAELNGLSYIKVPLNAVERRIA